MNLIEKTYAQTSITGSSFDDLIQFNSETSLSGIITFVITWIVYIVGVLAFIYLVYSGILYITAGGNPEQAKKGQQGIINAIIGILIAVLAWAILNAIASTGSTGSIS